jgi:hypothetical protein
VDRQAKAAPDFFREGLHLLSLYSFPAGHAEGQADYDFGHPVLANDLLQLGEIKALVLPVERFQSLRCNAQRVRKGEADPFRTNVQTQNSWRTPRRGSSLVRRHPAIICRIHIFAIKLRYLYGH